MPKIVQFLHPGSERTDVQWVRQGRHARRFVSIRGSYLRETNGKLINGDIAFWCEWEATANVLAENTDRNDGESRFIFSPTALPLEHRFRFNTDPFVFGQHFYYCFCQQASKTALRSLAPGSLILFGSHYRRTFIIDTVFVVGEGISYDRYSFSKLNALTNNLHYEVSIKPLFAIPAADTAVSMHYTALMHSENKSFFSFVPCIPARPLLKSFARPVINIESIEDCISNKLTQGVKITTASQTAILKAWGEITRQVISQGLQLMVKCELPESA